MTDQSLARRARSTTLWAAGLIGGILATQALLYVYFYVTPFVRGMLAIPAGLVVAATVWLWLARPRLRALALGMAVGAVAWVAFLIWLINAAVPRWD